MERILGDRQEVVEEDEQKKKRNKNKGMRKKRSRDNAPALDRRRAGGRVGRT